MQTFRKLLYLLPLSLIAALPPASAFATTATASLPISLKIAASCTIATPAAIDFGDAVIELVSVETGQTSLPVTCSNGTNFKLTADNGANYDSVNSVRRMASGSNYISYTLYTDSGYTNAFPTTTAAATNQAGTGAVQGIAMYGKVAGQATPPVGTYTDTVTLTVNY